MSDAFRKRFDELKVAENMPSPAGSALAILRLADSEKTQVNQITAVLEADPALAGRILKLANSAAYSASRPIASIKLAVCRLGIRTVRNVALAFSLLSRSSGTTCPGFDYKRFWSRSLATAVAAHSLAARCKDLPPDEAFTCGLLSNVGCLALATVFPQQYANILEQTRGQAPSCVAQREREEFALDHNEMLEALLKDWGLPELYFKAARWHEDPEEGDLAEGSRTLTLARVLHLASRLAEVCVAEPSMQKSLLTALLGRGNALGIEQAPLIALGDHVVQDWHQWGTFLDVPTQPVPSFSKLAEPAAPEDSAAAVSASPAQQVAQPAPLRILLIADRANQNSAFSACLAGAGHHVVLCDSAGDAMRAVVETNPQLLILDRPANGEQALSLCQRLRRANLGQGLYIIMTVGAGQEAWLEEHVDGDVDDLLPSAKPRAVLARVRKAQRFIGFQEQINRDKEELQRYAAELAVVNRRLQAKALEDDLTGLPNRRFAMDRLNEEWAATSRNGLPMACIIVDIDHFKEVNDTFGHDVGDAVLSAAAAVMRQSIRASDVVCRFGGEEFLILCRETALASAAICAERIRAAVEYGCKDVPGFAGRITVSTGVAARTDHYHQLHDLLKAADQALYRAKQSGRNRVCLANSVAARALEPAS